MHTPSANPSHEPAPRHPFPRSLSLVPAEPQQNERAGTPPLPSDRHGDPVLLTLCSSDGETRLITRTTRIGRAPDNDWVLPDPHVSQHHLLLIPDGERLRITDRGSRNGTLVNGARVERAEVPIGGCLTVGNTQLRLIGGAGAAKLCGDSEAMQRVRDLIQRHATNDLPVMILGESGTGKEVVARALHEQSRRRGDLVPVNCGALPRDLIESELFGHERGAFTGAQKRHLGCFGAADGGTLFLDEIGELPLELQPRLLRALETRSIRPVGGSREIPVDVRILAATHCNLEKAVQQGKFRLDLYYRLYGLDITLPPLRERPEDIAPLVRHFLRDLSGQRGPCTISDHELVQVARHPWPGNVRQLRHAVERAVHLAGPILHAADIMGPLPPSLSPQERSVPSHIPILGRRYDEIERDIYATVLAHTDNNRRAAAEMLGIPKSTLCDKLLRYALVPRRGAHARD